MMRFLPAFLLIPLIAIAAPQDAPNYDRLAGNCGSTVRWVADDPWHPEDGAPELGPEEDKPGVDRVEMLRDAQKRAHEQKKIILWFVFRVWGRQMYRAPLPERYLTQVLFTDPELVELVNRRFVPIRLFADQKVGQLTKIQALDFIEPGIVFMDSDLQVLHRVDRIRTFNADWFASLLTGVLKAHSHDKVEGDAEARILAGDYDGAAAAIKDMTGDKAGYLNAVLERRRGKLDLALGLLKKQTDPLAAAERGLILLRNGQLADAAPALEEAAKAETPRQAEAAYNLAVIARLQGRDADAAKQFAAVASRHATSPWGWRAAAALNKSKDTTPDSALIHAFEDPFAVREFGAGKKLPTDTSWKRGGGEVSDVARGAVTFLLRNQREDGSWSDTRYAYWPDPSILPNTRVAITSLACTALRAWRDADPARIDAALAKGEAYALDEKNMNRFKNEEIYADAYKLLLLSRKAILGKDKDAVKAMQVPIQSLEARQDKDGFWAHEYPNPFCTAAVLQCLADAKAAGGAVPDKMIQKGAAALLKVRHKDGSFPYDSSNRGGGREATKDAMARMPVCEAALIAAGQGGMAQFQAALNNWWATLDRFKIVRRNDFHSDGELAGFFFYHGIFHTSEALALLDAKAREPHQSRFIELLTSIPEIDGSFLDSHEMGKSYGTAMALLALKNAGAKLK